MSLLSWFLRRRANLIPVPKDSTVDASRHYSSPLVRAKHICFYPRIIDAQFDGTDGNCRVCGKVFTVAKGIEL